MYDRTDEFFRFTRAHSSYLKGNGFDFVKVSIATETVEGVEVESEFLSQIEILTKIITDMKVLTRRLDTLHRAALSEATSERYEKIRTEIVELCNKVTSKGSQGKTILKKLGAQIHILPSNSWKRAKFGSSCSELLETVRGYEIQENEYSQKYRKQYERQISLMDPNLTMNNKDLETFNGNSPKMFQVFRMEILDRERDQAKLDDLKSRFEEMQQIEKNSQEIQEVFKEISLLIQCQGESVNRIEDHLGETKGYLDSSLKALDKSLKIQKKRQRRRLIAFSISFIIFIILLAIVLHEALYLNYF